MRDDSVLFCGRKDDSLSDQLIHFLTKRFANVDVSLGSRPNEPLAPALQNWSGDYILSFRSLSILPVSLLKRARVAALNFHPGPPEYPGIGCINFALYDGASEFGVTCHHMEEKPDSGAIVIVRYFEIAPEDNVESLLNRTHLHLVSQFKEVVQNIASGIPLGESRQSWRGKATTRRDMERLYRLPPDIDGRELMRRIRATSYRNFQPWIELHGCRFQLAENETSGQ